MWLLGCGYVLEKTVVPACWSSDELSIPAANKSCVCNSTPNPPSLSPQISRFPKPHNGPFLASVLKSCYRHTRTSTHLRNMHKHVRTRKNNSLFKHISTTQQSHIFLAPMNLKKHRDTVCISHNSLQVGYPSHHSFQITHSSLQLSLSPL